MKYYFDEEVRKKKKEYKSIKEMKISLEAVTSATEIIMDIGYNRQ
jgi:hypothetical protein